MRVQFDDVYFLVSANGPQYDSGCTHCQKCLDQNGKAVTWQSSPSFGFYFGAFQSTGGVTWAMNFSDRFDLSGSEGWAFSWYTPFGTITSPAYEGLREGLDDRQLIETCRRQFKGHPEAEAVLAAILKEAVQARAKGGTDTVNDFYNSPAEVAKLDLWRNRLLDEWLKLETSH